MRPEGLSIKIGSNSDSVPKRELHIPQQADSLEHQIMALEECFGNLQGRLKSARSEEITSDDKEQTEAPSLTCPLAEQLRLQTAKIRRVCERINYQLSVLEI